MRTAVHFRGFLFFAVIFLFFICGLIQQLFTKSKSFSFTWNIKRLLLGNYWKVFSWFTQFHLLPLLFFCFFTSDKEWISWDKNYWHARVSIILLKSRMFRQLLNWNNDLLKKNHIFVIVISISRSLYLKSLSKSFVGMCL